MLLLAGDPSSKEQSLSATTIHTVAERELTATAGNATVRQHFVGFWLVCLRLRAVRIPRRAHKLEPGITCFYFTDLCIRQKQHGSGILLRADGGHLELPHGKITHGFLPFFEVSYLQIDKDYLVSATLLLDYAAHVNAR